jgi:N6-adenosine-specific RNA methylase IME4
MNEEAYAPAPPGRSIVSEGQSAVPDLTNLAPLYVAAKSALSKLLKIDEVKQIHDKAIAMQVYALQAKDRDLAEQSTEVKKRSRRRLGELIAERRADGRLAKGTRGQIKGVKPGEAQGGRKGNRTGGAKISPPVQDETTLAQLGVDKALAKKARKDAAMPEAEFESELKRAVSIALATIDGERAVLATARLKRHAEREAKRAEKERKLGQQIKALPNAKFGVILADPEWKFKTHSEKGLTLGSADNHYPTSSLEAIKARDVPSIAATDCVLFLWVTVPLLPEGLEVMKAWGFKYVTGFAWIKDKVGQGYWNRNKHEHLLVGVKGNPVSPAQGKLLWPSAFEAPARGHSIKPDKAYELIEQYFPTTPKIELNARAKRDGWVVWGNEAPE